MNVAKMAERIEAAAVKRGYTVLNTKFAETGTAYLIVEYGIATLKIRVADHADAYGTANYSADGTEGTVQGAIAYLDRRANEEDARIAAEQAESDRIAALDPESRAAHFAEAKRIAEEKNAAMRANDAAREARRAEVRADGRYKTKSGSQYIANVISRDEYLARKPNPRQGSNPRATKERETNDK